MATKAGGAYIEIRADNKKLKGDLDKSHKKVLTAMNKMQSQVSTAFKRMAGIGVASTAAVALGLSKVISAANEQEAVTKRLESVIKATDRAAGFNIKQMEKMAASMQKVTTVGDEMILGGMAILATFKNIRGEAFERTTKAALDMSEVMQQDVKSSMVMLGKAMNDPIKNLSAMSRAGVQFTDTQTKMIKELWASGKTLEAHNIILKELESQFGGAAAAARNTFRGAVKAAMNAMGDMEEQIGFSITKNEVLIGTVKDAEQWFIKAGDAIGEWANANDKLIAQKTHEAINNIKTSVKDMIELYQGLPDDVIGAAGYGILGRILTGSTPIGMFVSAMVLLNGQLKKLYTENDAAAARILQAGGTVDQILNAADPGNGALSFSIPEFDGRALDRMRITLDHIKKLETEINKVISGGGSGSSGGLSNDAQLKALQVANQKKYALTIAAAKKVKKDLWMLEEQHEADKLAAFEDGVTQKTQMEYDAMVKAAENKKKLLEEEQDELQKVLDEQQAAYEHMGDNIHDVFSTLYKGLLDGQTDVFDQILASFKSMIAEMMAQASKDLVMNIIFGGSGSSSTGGSGMLGQLGSKISSIFTGSGSGGGLGLDGLFGAGGVFGSGAGPGAGQAGIGSKFLSPAGTAWQSMITGIGSAGVIAAGAMIAGKVLGRMMADKPQFGISGMSKEAWKFGTGSFDREINPYEIAMENMYDDFKSNLYDYRVFAADFDNEPEMRNTLFTYFDTVFANVDKAMSTNINDVLKDYQHLGVSFRLTEDMNAEQALKGLSSAVFSELLGSMLLGVLPGQGNMDQIVSTIVGSKRITAGDLAAKNAPKPGSREFYDSSGFSVQGKGSGADTYLYSEPVYEDIIHQVSAVADIFNTAFFEAIMPEGSTTWDAFISFSDTVKKTTDFMEKFDNRVNNLGLSSVEAYNQIAFVSNALAELDAAVENMNLNVMQVTIKTLVEGFNALNDELKTANATTEELTEAQELQNSIFAGTVKEMAAPTAAIFQQMADSVKNFVFNADQLKMQQIAGQGEKINKFFTELYEAVALTGNTSFIAQLDAVKKGFSYVVYTLMTVQGLNLYKGHLQTIGSAKAGIAGLGNEFASAQIGQKYGFQLGTTAEQAAFVKNVMSMSTSEFISGVESHNVSVEEATQDLITMANIVKETSRAFSDIQISISATIKSLENQLGVGASSTLSGIMQEFNKTAGEAMSSDPATATAGAEKLSNLTGKAMKKALETAKNSYEYNKIWSKVLGTLKDVEYSTGKTVTALEIVDPKAQLTELQNIATDIGLIDTGIGDLLNEQTFKDYYDAFNIAFNNGAVFNNLNSTLISLPSALGSAFGSISLNASAGLSQALTDIAAALGIQPTYPGGTVTSSLAISPDNEQTILQRYGAGGYTKTEVSAFIKNFQGMSLGEKGAAYPDRDLAQLGQDVNKLTSAYGYAEGGIATGPKSGYSALLHGTEAIIPMGKGNIPLTLQNDYSEGILLEIKGLRTELRNVNAVNSLKIKKIKQTLDRVSDGGTTFAVETK